MGLTVNYNLNMAKGNDADKTVKAMRDICMDLPFHTVGDVMELSSRDINRLLARRGQNDLTEAEETQLWFVSGAGQSIRPPWNKNAFKHVEPIRIIGFTAWPGEGCESSDFGLCIYPESIELQYRPQDDSRFQLVTKKGNCISYHDAVDYKKWERHCKKTMAGGWQHPRRAVENRTIPTNIKAWSWRSSCKTQYASNPDCGGLPNFLRCHITLITALERMNKISGLKVKINDEGKYGPSKYSDDWQEARAAGREPKYVPHKGTYSPAVLAKELGEYNDMMAAMFGALKDALPDGFSGESPIQDFQNFEELEFKGQQSKNVEGFLKAMEAVCKKTVRIPIVGA